jgi:hypothetical protein
VRITILAARLVAAAGVVLLGSVGWVGASGAATPGVPYTDPSAVGYIGLCNQAGQQITSGSVTTTPFVWRAVSSEAAPKGYNGPSRTATLTAYLPLQVLPPGDWSGEQLTASSRYSNPANPMAAATSKDVPLETFIQDFPPQWDGFIQLRMFLGAANQETYSLRYPSLDIQVTGDTWQAFGGGPVNCNSGTSESIETVLLPGATTARDKGAGSGSDISSGAGSGTGTSGGSAGPGKSTGGSGAGSSGPGGLASKGSGSGARPGTAGPATTASSTTSHVPLIIGIVIAALAILVTLALLITRRRRGPDPLSPESASGS